MAFGPPVQVEVGPRVLAQGGVDVLLATKGDEKTLDDFVARTRLLTRTAL
jgi:hypothetical protein